MNDRNLDEDLSYHEGYAPTWDILRSPRAKMIKKARNFGGFPIRPADRKELEYGGKNDDLDACQPSKAIRKTTASNTTKRTYKRRVQKYNSRAKSLNKSSKDPLDYGAYGCDPCLSLNASEPVIELAKDNPNTNCTTNRSSILNKPRKEGVLNEFTLDSLGQKKPLHNDLEDLKEVMKLVFFEPDKITTDIVLDFNQMVILSSVLERKLANPVEIKNVYDIRELMAANLDLPEKRTEDYLKITFKYGFRHLKARFMSDNEDLVADLSAEESVARFYQYYFEEAAQKASISIKNFYLPKAAERKAVKVNNTRTKTINSNYLSLVFQSPSFASDLADYLNTQFVEDYVLASKKKVDKLCKKWNKIYKNSPCDFKAVESISNFVLTCKKNRFPWFAGEVKKAIEAVKSIIAQRKS